MSTNPNSVSKDALQDLIQNTLGLGGIDLIKITGTATETAVNACAEDRTVIMSSKFKQQIPGFTGVFGMTNLGKLKTILGFTDEYDENAQITVATQSRDGVDQPVGIHFENKKGDFVNDYRLMSKAIVEEKVKNVVFKGAAWNVDFGPKIPGIQRLKKQASVHSEEATFATTIANGNLNISFGDISTHSGNFTFEASVSGSLSRALQWPVKQFLAIMDLPGDKHIYISDQGVMRITVDSGIAEYEYLLPAQAK
jgi:hypothetical protein